MPMSIISPTKAVSDIIHRAVSDAAFRNQLYTNPGAALAGSSLTADERAALTDHATVAELIRRAGG